MTRRFWFFTLALCSAMGSVAQDAAPLSEDSISAMLSQWHALPQAEVASVGLAAGARGIDEVPGALHVIRPAELERFAHTDPLRVLRAVSGVNIQEEDGYGLRPNIGLRGSGSERSARITLMEDGILIAPAPYTAPAAYYFPSIARMQSVEILKGSSQIAFGPQTAGGAINFVTPQAADEGESVMYRSEVSGYGGFMNHLRVRQQWTSRLGTWSGVMEGLQVGSAGFKSLPGGDPTGFSKTDWMAKLRWDSPTDRTFRHSVEWKTGRVHELSHETYAGLSESDFQENPFQRYAASQRDEMTSAQQQQVLRHRLVWKERLEFQTDGYQTEFARNWYKLDRLVHADGTKLSLLSLFESGADSVLKSTTPLGAELQLKANNRAYFARGIQHRTIVRGTGGNQCVIGVRYHEDAVDRMEWRDGYRLEDGVLRLQTRGELGSAGNRVDGARAFAGYLRGTLRWGRSTWTPGVRTERMEFCREDYIATDVDRDQDALSERHNTVHVWLPGLGVHYALSGEQHVFAGVHRGFIPPGSAPETQPETSINIETGYRWNTNRFSGQAVAFHNIYNRLLGSDLTANGGLGTGDLFNGGSARTRGFELEAALQLLDESRTWAMPVRLTYTYTDARFTSSFESDFGPWSSVESGDYLPYLAPHQGNAQISMVSSSWSGELNVRYVAAMRTVAGSGPLVPAEATDQATLVDAVIRKEWDSRFQWYIGVNNAFDSVVVVARRPAGLRPGMPRLIRTGIRFAF